ncbi:primosomal protein DnaI [Thermolongibacillus altinsuensis]|jgi:primosomal protein DnaI|uniref:Primosomal protein DnaI n=1 Tax=Thermolongibacillus altinsuensis TaxID=575256 RepID=A0A4R1QG89_9BACL|nr:primosomal protein DnaI [Thermolongibacillus altinsuensis]TCL51849.1 primosomal protein DnaI [Thermolongibacillus altinsuensis]
MKPIRETIHQLMNRTDFKQRYEAMKKEVLNNQDVQQFLREHQAEVTEEMIERNLVKLYEFAMQSHNCRQCPTLEKCPNLLKGYHPHLVLQGKSIELQYERCAQKIQYDERKKQESLIQTMFIPNEILRASFSNLATDDLGRIKAIDMAEKFALTYEVGKKMKGLYLYGSFGVGKTYLLGAIANKLAERKIPSLLIYVPEFSRSLKTSLQSDSFNEKLDYVKKVPVLMLDDLGAELMSSWWRDEVLGPILQYRMLENLPTFFTSNFDLNRLSHHLAHSQRGEEEQVKATRIIERIIYLATVVEVKGKNRRIEAE